MFSGLLDSLYADPTFKEWKSYMRHGLDNATSFLPDRETMKGYIDGPYDDYLIDKVADGYGYLRGLLDEAPDPYAGYDPTAEYMELNQKPYDPTAEAMAVQAMPDSSIKQLFQRKRPRIMEAVQGAYEASPRPSTGAQDMYNPYKSSDYPEYQQLRMMSPQPGANSTSVKIMDGMYRQPEGLLGGQLAPQGFAEEKATVQPLPPKGFAKPIEELQNMLRYLDNSTRDRVKRGQDLDARMMTEQRRIRNALAR